MLLLSLCLGVWNPVTFASPTLSYIKQVIDGLCKDKELDEALDLFSQMKSRGISADIITYTSLIRGQCSLDDGLMLRQH